MKRSERFKMAFDYLLKIGKIHKKSQLGEMMGYTRSVVSNAYNGNDDYATNIFLARFCAVFPDVFNYEWLLNETGEMLQSSQKPQEASVISEVNNSTPETLSELVGQITRLLNKIDEKDAKIEELMKENNELREELNGGYLSKKRS